MLATGDSKRPRNVDTPRAAAILYGDWGTSKAYVIGLAFAVSGYSSFWLIAAMCGLTALVGLNYVVVCRCYPDGGGVYAAVRHRSEVISIVGAFLLIADYIVTASISALSAFQYLGVPRPELFAAGAILLIGALNYLGPKHTGGLALWVSIPTVAVVVLIALFALPYLGKAAHNIQPLHGGFFQNWNGFVSIVLALSGVEAIAGATGVMRLNPGATEDKPVVTKTSTPALLWVALEVCFFTAFLAFVMHALPGLERVVQAGGTEVNAPGAEGVRDYMLRYMAQVFVGNALGATVGQIAGWAVSGVFGFLLLSAVNTAIGGLVTISFIMSRDRELPAPFERVNRYGVPNLGLIVSTVVPAVLVVIVSDISGLADLYAVGVVGAIATNLGATSTDKHLPLKPWERYGMFFTFLVMLAIELSLFIDKPQARVFVSSIMAVGLVMRALAREKAQRGAFIIVLLILVALVLESIFALHGDFKPVIVIVSVLAAALIVRGLVGERALRRQAIAPAPGTNAGLPPLGGAATAVTGAGGDARLVDGSQLAFSAATVDGADGLPMLCAVRGIGRTLDFAIDEARETKRPLYLLFIREQIVITSEDKRRKWQQDEEASTIFQHAKGRAGADVTILPCYAVSDSAADTIVDIAATVGASRLLLGAPQRSGIVNLLRGNIIRQVAGLLPENIHLLVYA